MLSPGTSYPASSIAAMGHAAQTSAMSEMVKDGDHFAFRANRDFWNYFVEQVRTYPGALDPPHFHVDSSHTDESVLVNQEFLRRFAAGWSTANPHEVKVTSPKRGVTTHDGDDFWNKMLEVSPKRQQSGPSEADLAAIKAAELERQRKDMAMQDAKLAQQRQQVADLMKMLEEANEAARRAALRGDQEADLAGALTEADRLRAELDIMRGAQNRAQQTWDRDRQGLEDRLAQMERALAALQSDAPRQRAQTQAELDARERELQHMREVARLAEMKKELEMREKLQEELCRAQREAQQEADERARQDIVNRAHDELQQMRRAVIDHAMQQPPAQCQPMPMTACVPAPMSACVPSPGMQLGPPPLEPQPELQEQKWQRTVTTQTPPTRRSVRVTQSGMPAPGGWVQSVQSATAAYPSSGYAATQPQMQSAVQFGQQFPGRVDSAIDASFGSNTVNTAAPPYQATTSYSAQQSFGRQSTSGMPFDSSRKSAQFDAMPGPPGPPSFMQ